MNWSFELETGRTEDSIYKSYQHLISTAEKYIFIENQFFVTSSDNESSRVQNQIGRFLGERVARACRDNEEFKIYIVIPCVPGMNGRLEKNTAAGQEVILHLTYESISRGEHSIKAYCLRNGVQDWEKYIFFWSGYISTQFSQKIFILNCFLYGLKMIYILTKFLYE